MLHSETKLKNGSALLLIIVVTAVLLVLTAFLLKIAYNSYVTANALWEREEAFWLAEAGLEKGKAEINFNPAWYTDLPYFLEDNLEWLKVGAVGERDSLGRGYFKVVREKDRDRLYSIGYKGRAVVVLKINYLYPPFKTLSWEEL